MSRYSLFDTPELFPHVTLLYGRLAPPSYKFLLFVYSHLVHIQQQQIPMTPGLADSVEGNVIGEDNPQGNRAMGTTIQPIGRDSKVTESSISQFSRRFNLFYSMSIA